MSTAIVTGASRGLGLELARALVDRGWLVVANARGQEELARAWSGVPSVLAVPGDVADAEHRLALVETAGPKIDLLVNNASVLGPSPLPSLAEYPLEELRRVYEINVLAPLGLIQLALPRLSAGARILDIT